jgi:hypothetical protein
MNPRLRRLKEDPEFHIERFQGVKTLEACHRKIIEAVKKYNRVAIKACHGIGKTFTLARLVLWFMSTHKPSKTLTTAPTARQVNELLWDEIRKGHRQSRYPIGGEVLENPVWKFREEWFALGYSPDKGREHAKEGQINLSSFQGFHSPNQLLVLDEATGIAKNIWDQTEGMMTSANAKMVAIGNPTTKNCEFYRKFQSRIWTPISINVFDSPNLIANNILNEEDLKRELDRLLSLSDDEMRLEMQKYRVVSPAITTTQWVMTMALPTEWGLDSIRFRTRALGEWPEVEEDAFFTERDVQKAITRRTQEIPTSRYIGVDPARFGNDKSIGHIIEGFKVISKFEMSGKDTHQQAVEIISRLNKLPRLKDEKILVDSTGVGGGVADTLKAKQKEGLIPKSILIVEVNFGERADEDSDPKWKRERDIDRYANKKAKVLDLLSQDIKSNLCLLNDEVYKKELPTLLYDYDNKGRKRAESKDDYKARTGMPSPDTSESLAIANYGRHVNTVSQIKPGVIAL